MHKIIAIAFTFILFSCVSGVPGKPHSVAIKETRACVDHFEELALFMLSSAKFSATMQEEKHKLADKNHRLITLDDSLSKTDCIYRGMRHYGKTIVVEIRLFSRRDPEKAIEGEVFMERHFLVLGDLETFDPGVLLWRDNEEIILEEEVGKESRLFVTHSAQN